MHKQMIMSAFLLLIAAVGFVACNAGESSRDESAALSAATLEAQSGNAVATPDGVVGEYLSEVGDGEILSLREDGTFVAYTMTDMCSDACSITMTETVRGRYTDKETAYCTLTIETLDVKVDGMEAHPDQVEAYVDLLAGEDETLRDMYTRLFEGETIEGAEFCGEEEFARLLQTEVIVELDFENGTFSYQDTNK